jgi:hypothetical protein
MTAVATDSTIVLSPTVGAAGESIASDTRASLVGAAMEFV